MKTISSLLKVQTSDNILLQTIAPKMPAKASYDKFDKFGKEKIRTLLMCRSR